MMMGSKAKTIVGILTFAAFIGAALLAYNFLSAKAGSPKVLSEPGAVSATENGQGEPPKIAAPDFTVQDAAGNEVKLSNLAGKPVVLNFWASWCPPCKSEMPEFNKVYEELGGEVTFMMVDLVDGARETAETGAAYVAEQGFTFPVYYDTSGEAASAYGVSAIPSTVFIDKDGNAVTGAQGAIDEATLRKGISFITPSA
jgi:thiol-disulfide isomerase/thioredoxin